MEPSDPPPSYTEAQQQSSTSPSTSTTAPAPSTSHLQVPTTHKMRNGIPPHVRRSMEDESRPLPSGWLRQYDPQTHHQFFVDTRVEPARTIWHHPYDDDVYLASLSEREREEIKWMKRVPTREDLEAVSSDEDHDYHEHEGVQGGVGGQGQGEGELHGVHKFGRKMKDRLTGSTHQEREQRRRQREAEEQEAYRRHLHFRNQMRRAAETGEPQLLGKDAEGREVYVEPPYDAYGGGGMGRGYGYDPYRGGAYGGGMGGMGTGMGIGGGGGFGISDRGGKRYLTPSMPYARPYGGGFGGGYGMPLMGLGGLGGGLMLGSLLF